MDKLKWDFFIAHSYHDTASAERLYKYLSENFSVFLDTKSISLGDDWDILLQQAQNNSCVTLVLVSSKTENSYYQREEIAAAIKVSRAHQKTRKTIPVYLDDDCQVPYGLRLKQGITVTKKNGLKEISRILRHQYEIFKNDAGLSSQNEPVASSSVKTTMPEKKVKKTNSQDDKYRPNKMKNATFEDFDNQKKLVNHIKKGLEPTDCVMWIDLDGFTSVNKKYGASIADSIIGIVMSIIEFGAKPYPCKLYHVKNRDDFIIITNYANAETVGESLIKSMDSYEWSELAYGMYIHCSIGVGINSKKDKPLAVIKKSKLGLMEAKKRGGNSICTQKGILSFLDVNIYSS